MKGILNVKEEIEAMINTDALGISSQRMAEFVVASRYESPLCLVYRGKNGRMILTSRIRNDLSSLVGFKIGSEDVDGNEVSKVIFFNAVTKRDLKEMGCCKSITLGDIRKFIVENIHPAARILDQHIADMLWKSATEYYTMKYLLSMSGFEIPEIMIVQSCERNVSDSSNIMDWNAVRDKSWDYCNDRLVQSVIDPDTPILCYCDLI